MHTIIAQPLSTHSPPHTLTPARGYLPRRQSFLSGHDASSWLTHDAKNTWLLWALPGNLARMEVMRPCAFASYLNIEAVMAVPIHIECR